jgi:D-sedoheptulose 7-phosphate isomerase
MVSNELVEAIYKCYKAGGKVMILGNGGLCCEAEHFACELVGMYGAKDTYIPCIALTTSTALLTALSNDIGFDKVFSHQIKVLGKQGDVLIAMTSHNSKNIEMALWAGREKKLFTVAICGMTSVNLFGDLVIPIEGNDTAEMQENTMKYLHELAAKVKEGVADGLPAL